MSKHHAGGQSWRTDHDRRMTGIFGDRVICHYLGRLPGECSGPIERHHVVELADGGSRTATVPACRRHHQTMTNKNRANRTGRPVAGQLPDDLQALVRPGSTPGRPGAGRPRQTTGQRAGQRAGQRPPAKAGQPTGQPDGRPAWIDRHLIAAGVVLVVVSGLWLADMTDRAVQVAAAALVYAAALAYVAVTRRTRARDRQEVHALAVRAIAADPRMVSVTRTRWRWQAGMWADIRSGRVFFPGVEVAADPATRARVERHFWLALHARVSWPAHALHPFFDFEVVAPDAVIPVPQTQEAEAAAENPHADICQKITDGLREDWKISPKLSLTVEVAEVDADGIAAFTIEYPSKVADSSDEVRRALLDKVAAKAGHRWTGQWNTKANRVRVVRRPPLPERIDNPMGSADDPGTGLPWHVIAFGDEEGGGLACIDVKREPHTLITGRTRQGKTVNIRTIMLRAAANGFRVVGIDPKQVEFDGYQDVPGIEIYDEDEANVRAVEMIHAEMKDRYRLKRERVARLDSHEPILLACDEYQEWVEVANGLHKADGGKGDHPAVDMMKSIARLGALANIFIILLTQRSDASWFSGILRENMGNRMGVGRLSAEAARMLGFRGGAGQDVPPIKGRTTFRRPDGQVAEAQGWWTPNPEADDLTDDDRQLIGRVLAFCANRRPWPKSAAPKRRAAVYPPASGPVIVDVDELGLMLDDQDRIDVIDCESREEFTVVGVDEGSVVTYLLDDGSPASYEVDDSARFEIKGGQS